MGAISKIEKQRTNSILLMLRCRYMHWKELKQAKKPSEKFAHHHCCHFSQPDLVERSIFKPVCPASVSEMLIEVFPRMLCSTALAKLRVSRKIINCQSDSVIPSIKMDKTLNENGGTFNYKKIETPNRDIVCEIVNYQIGLKERNFSKIGTVPPLCMRMLL